MPSTLPTLDFFSMTAVVAINMMAMSAALPLAMGRRVSGAARSDDVTVVALRGL